MSIEGKPTGAGSEALERRLEELFRDRLEVDVPTPDLDLLDTGIVDSLRFVELLLAVEEEFGTPIDLEEVELEHFRSIRSIARFVDERPAAGAA